MKHLLLGFCIYCIFLSSAAMLGSPPTRMESYSDRLSAETLVDALSSSSRAQSSALFPLSLGTAAWVVT